MMKNNPGGDDLNESDTARILRLLDSALEAMNKAVHLTIEQGPAAAMEYIADYLNDTDSADDDVVVETPEDWLTRWEVIRIYDLTKEGNPTWHERQ